MSLLNGLVSYYKFDETSGTTANDSVGSNHGTLSNARIFTRSTDGKIRTGADFRGGNDSLDSSTLGSGILSFGGWIHIESLSSQSIPLCVVDSGSNTRKWFIQLTTGGKFRVAGFTTSFQYVDSNSTYSVGGIHHVVFVKENSSVFKLYINGVLEGTLNQTLTVPTNPIFRAGAGMATNGALTEYHNGWIDECFVFNRALSATEVTQLYNMQKGGSPSGSYPFSTMGVFLGGGI
jgi:hypothetical protein